FIQPARADLMSELLLGIGVPCLPTKARDQVGHVRLMLEHQQCRDVAVSGWIAFRVEGSRHRCQNRREQGWSIEIPGWANDWKIPEMANRYSLPGYIPAAPSLIEVRTMVHHETGCVRILVVGHREGADRRPARNPQRVPGQVALQ